MNGYALVSALIQAHMPDAAGELAALLAEREEEVPRLKALEFELDFLRRNVFGSGYAAVVAKRSEDDQEVLLAWNKVSKPINGRLGEIVVVEGSPRLESILAGELPSLDAFREGRTP